MYGYSYVCSSDLQEDLEKDFVNYLLSRVLNLSRRVVTIGTRPWAVGLIWDLWVINHSAKQLC